MNRISRLKNLLLYKKYIRDKEPKGYELKAESRNKFSYSPKYSVVIPLYMTNEVCFEELLQSFLEQTYSNFELCLADASPLEHKKILKEICDKYTEKGLVINYIPLEENLGISGNTNEAIKASSGEFIVFCDHDDIVSKDTLYSCTKALNENPAIDAFYSEQDYLSADGKKRRMPIFKPDLDMELLRNCNYITHIFVVRKNILDAVGLLNPKMDGSQDYDFILRVCEYTKNICHIPKVLYHWRLLPTSTAAAPTTKMYAYDAGKNAIAAHLKRQGIEFEDIEYDMDIGRYHVSYVIKDNPKVSVVVNSTNPCITKALKNQDYSNYEIVNSPKEAGGSYLLFLGENVIPEGVDFIKELLYFAQREDVGAIAPRIDYKNGRIYSMGKVLGIKGFVEDGLNNVKLKSRVGRWWGYSVRNVSAVGFSAFMTKKDLYFFNLPDEKMGDYKDLDFCLNLRKQGKCILVTPYSKAYYIGKNNDEKAVGKKELLNKWGDLLKSEDPYYNKNFNKDRANYNL